MSLFFYAQLTVQRSGSHNVENYFALHDIRSDYFRPHQLVTYMFLHGGLCIFSGIC